MYASTKFRHKCHLVITLLFSSVVLAVPFNITHCNLHATYCFVISFIAQQLQSDLKTNSREININNLTTLIKRPSHGKLKLANSCWQTQVGVCERPKNRRQTRFYLTPTVCKRVCRLFLCRSHTLTWVCQHEFAV